MASNIYECHIVPVDACCLLHFTLSACVVWPAGPWSDVGHTNWRCAVRHQGDFRPWLRREDARERHGSPYRGDCHPLLSFAVNSVSALGHDAIQVRLFHWCVTAFGRAVAQCALLVRGPLWVMESGLVMPALVAVSACLSTGCECRVEGPGMDRRHNFAVN